ncbi:MAG: 30S ribosomal protein S8 [Phycisphaerae bacterium]
MWSDPIADMLTRIRNAVRVRAAEVRMPSSRMKVGIAEVLKAEGYIAGYEVIDDGKIGLLRIQLKYGPDGERVINAIERVSKPGRRVYAGVDEVPRPLDGLGIAVVSTNRGIKSDRQCRAEKIGGELLCTVY